jgi:hypothetical protein
MWRSFFLALGLCSCLLGAECLVIDKAVLVERKTETAAPTRREIKPAEWAPWSLLSGGAVVMLYSFTLPKKLKE